MTEICSICKGSKKILLLRFEEDCECVISNKVIHISELNSGEIGYEAPPTNVPYLIRINNDFIYVEGSKDSSFDHLIKYKFEENDWPPDLSSTLPNHVIIIARNIKTLKEAKEAIRIHEQK